VALFTPILFRWLPPAFLTTALSALVYLAAQQVGRQLANDPQIQLARDAAIALATGRPVESVVPTPDVNYGRSLAPFLMVLDDAGTVVASSGRLNGRMPEFPAGVLDHARQTGEERVTWQPEPGVRLATVVVRRPDAAGGFVIAGRSLSETEARYSQFQNITIVVWVVTLAGLFALVAAGEFVIARSSSPTRLRGGAASA